MSETSALRPVLREGFEATLAPAGFVHNRDRRKWARETGGVVHTIVLGKRHGQYGVDWGIVCPELVEPIWDLPYVPFDASLGVVLGSPSDIARPAKAKLFGTEELAGSSDEIAAGLASDLASVAEWMATLSSRSAVCEYLLANRERSDPRGFTFPSALGVKLLVAAGLAALDRDPRARELLIEAELTMHVNDTSRRRVAKVRELIQSNGG